MELTMNVFKISVMFILLMVLSISSAQSAPYSDRRSLSKNGNYISLEEAALKAKHRYKGRVLSTEADEQGRYRIRVLTKDGRVRRLQVDPYTGDFLRPGRNR